MTKPGDSPATSWEEKYEKEHKLRQEAEGELTILKGIETNRVKEAQDKSNQLQDELDRVKKENNDLYMKYKKLSEEEENVFFLEDFYGSKWHFL
mgnify:CR=1 FL=1